jgi:hypothetical protein
VKLRAYDYTTCPRLVPLRTPQARHCLDCQTTPCRLNQWGQGWALIAGPGEPAPDTLGPFAWFAAPWAWATS